MCQRKPKLTQVWLKIHQNWYGCVENLINSNVKYIFCYKKSKINKIWGWTLFLCLVYEQCLRFVYCTLLCMPVLTLIQHHYSLTSYFEQFPIYLFTSTYLIKELQHKTLNAIVMLHWIGILFHISTPQQ